RGEVGVEAPVAGGAGHALPAPGGCVAIGGEVEVLAVFRGVAPGAVGVPVHALARPVAPVARPAIIPGEDIQPAVVGHIANHAGGLQTVAGQAGQVLAHGGVADHAH